MLHERNGVTIDTHATHPTVVFVQDAATKFTVALDRATGLVVGVHAGAATLPAVKSPVWEAVAEWQERSTAPKPWYAAAGYDHVHSCEGCGDVTGCYAPCGRPMAFVCGGCGPEDEDINY